MCLCEVKRGESVFVSHVSDDEIRVQLIRLGIGAGSVLKCMEKIPFGPLMVRHNRQEIALGRRIAGKIAVELQ